MTSGNKPRTDGIKKDVGAQYHAAGYLRLRLTDIALPSNLEENLDRELVALLAESLKVDSLIHPILVRRRKKKKGRREFVIAIGKYRYMAHKLLELAEIDCKLFDGDKNDVERVQLSEDLFRKQLDVLDRANKLARYYHLASAELTISGQTVQKSGPGRRPGGAALAARKLVVAGPTAEARRKKIARALTISTILPEVQEAIRQAGLQNKQTALLKIARAGSSARVQLKAVKNLASQTSRRATTESTLDAKRNAPKGARGASSAASTSKKTEEVKPKQTTLLELETQFWTQEGKKLWVYAPFEVRERFIDQARRIRCKAKADVSKFIQTAFQGRKKLPAKALRHLARMKGLSWTALLLTMKALRYKKIRKGYWSAVVHYYLNPDPNWANELQLISDKDIAAAATAAQAERDNRTLKATNAWGEYGGRDKERLNEEYYIN